MQRSRSKTNHNERGEEAMSCNCADDVDEKLKPHNTAMERAWVMNDAQPNNPRLMIKTYQIETGRGKAKAKAMFINFCPFCGTRYDAAPADPVSP